MLRILRSLFLATAIVLAMSITVMADQPPDPGSGGPGTGDLPVGGGSPIGGGLIILLSFGVGYGLKKVYNIKKLHLNE
jgi:hypothetical protein